MELSNQFSPTKNRGSSGEFYAHSAFHNSTFFIAACLFVLDLILCAFALVMCLRHSNLQAAFCTGFGVVFLVALWFLALRAHEEIHVLFEAGQIKELEKGSALDKVLDVTTRMIISGLFGAFALAGFCLVAFGLVLLSR
jgi:hypothetical protein